MAPIKFEENIKDKLENRTLSPSADAWSKLSERLDEEDRTIEKPIFWWLSIAAGLLLMIAIFVQFFNANADEKVIPQVVEKEVEKIELENKELEQETRKLIQLAAEEPEVAFKKQKIDPIRVVQTIQPKNEIKNSLKNKTLVAEQKARIKEETLNEEAQDLFNEAMMKNVVADALVQLKSENTLVTDREIDSLLKLANKALFKDKLQNETSKTVDAEALLQSVEEDMGQSFRSKVFNALKGSYETVKTAVAERNN